MVDKDIYTMTLFEEFFTDSGNKIIRVPGGWIYESLSQNQNAFGKWEWEKIGVTFIPFDNEFQKKGGTP